MEDNYYPIIKSAVELGSHSAPGAPLDLNEVAAKSGYPLSAIYYSFQNTKGLIAESRYFLLRELAKEGQECLSEEDPAAFVAAWVKKWLAHPSYVYFLRNYSTFIYDLFQSPLLFQGSYNYGLKGAKIILSSYYFETPDAAVLAYYYLSFQVIFTANEAILYEGDEREKIIVEKSQAIAQGLIPRKRKERV